MRIVDWLIVALTTLLLGGTYFSAFRWLVSVDWAKEDYSHCLLVPLICAYLIWDKRAELGRIRSAGSWLSLLPLGLGIFLFWLGELAGEYFTFYISFWLVAVGLIWVRLGWRKVRVIVFPLLLLLATFPFPEYLNRNMSLKLKLISSRLGVGMLHAYGMSAYREGNVIDLGFTQLQVVDACSGLRYVLPLAVLSLLMAYWFRAPLWKKAILFLSSLPLAIFINSMRIALTGILYSLWGASVAEEFFHGFSGWLIFIVTIPVLLLEMWILRKIGGKTESATEPVVNEKRIISPAVEQMLESPPSLRSAMLQPVFITAIVLLAATFAFSRGVEFREKVPIKKSFNEFPLTIGEWTGTRQSLEQQFIDSLHFSEYIMVSYRDPKGREIDFYVAYYETQRKGETTHSPETCLPGSGWSFEQAGLAGIADGDGRMIEVNRALMEKSGSRQLIHFWFPQRGRILTSLFQVKLYSFWDALTRQRTDGALVRVITPVYESERLEDAEKRLQGFTREIAPALGEFIPG